MLSYLLKTMMNSYRDGILDFLIEGRRACLSLINDFGCASSFFNMNLLRFFASYLKTEKALQWWSKRQSMHLFQESHKIRDQLLQESFVLRRSIELDLAENPELLRQNHQAWLNQLEQLHHSLEKLSDRLVPAYTEDSLPIAIQCLINSWQIRNLPVKFQLDLPTGWREEQPERNLLIVKILDELLRINLTNNSKKILIYIGLKRLSNVEKLTIQATYTDNCTIIKPSKSEELEYLSQTFRVLTSGQCFYRREDSKISWYFSWELQENHFCGDTGMWERKEGEN
jgi:hypothetical protein